MTQSDYDQFRKTPIPESALSEMFVQKELEDSMARIAEKLDITLQDHLKFKFDPKALSLASLSKYEVAHILGRSEADNN